MPRLVVVNVDAVRESRAVDVRADANRRADVRADVRADASRRVADVSRADVRADASRRVADAEDAVKKINLIDLFN